jgi:hypothetical protein
VLTAIQQALIVLATGCWFVLVKNGIPLKMQPIYPKKVIQAKTTSERALVDALTFVSQGSWQLEIQNGLPTSVKPV